MTRTSRERIRRTAVHALAACAVTLVVLELGARVMTGSLFTWGSLRERDQYARVDPVVGHVPKPGLVVHMEHGVTMSTGPHGTRHNGSTPDESGSPTLVVGDSFAFGDEVSDDQTWPAFLERRTGERVVNAAVPGFGLDQAVLRAERLAPIYSPELVIVSLIPHDIRRCEMSIWSGNAKPYFEPTGRGLVYHPAPTRSPFMATLTEMLGYSALVNALFHEQLERDGDDRVEHDRGDEVGCLLMSRLATLGEQHGARVVVLAQPQSPLPNEPRYGGDARDDVELVNTVLGCARARGLATLNLIPVVAALSPEERAGLFHHNGHNSPAGNRLIAGEVAAFLASEPSLDAASEGPR